MRRLIIVLWMVLCSIASAAAQMTVSVGIDLPAYPELVPVSGYPVYFAPRVDANYFFYDSAYWVYERDNWYRSSWYNGPWQFVAPEAVPSFILRVPVRYYRQPPAYFGGWRSNAPPRWDDHWGRAWAERRRGWDRWNRSAVPPPAPLPVYQRQYSGDRYPRAEQQQTLQSQNYRYQPRETAGHQRSQTQRAQSEPNAPVSSPPMSSPQGRQGTSRERIPAAQDQRGSGRSSSFQQGAASAPRGPPQESRGQEKGHDKGEQRSGERNQ